MKQSARCRYWKRPFPKTLILPGGRRGKKPEEEPLIFHLVEGCDTPIYFAKLTRDEIVGKPRRPGPKTKMIVI